MQAVDEAKNKREGLLFLIKYDIIRMRLYKTRLKGSFCG